MWKGAGPQGGATQIRNKARGLIEAQVMDLLPTPRTSDTNGPGLHGDGGMDLRTNWGPYAPAIHRWERALGRPAPSPTEPNKNGKPRLSPAFTEWMMGVPEGWITDTPGVSRNDQLKACGNGVVVRQAVAAISDMLQAFGEAE